MKKLLLLFIGIELVLFVSCNNRNVNNYSAFMQETSNVKKIPLDAETQIFNGYTQFYVDTNDVAYFSVMNPFPGSHIDIYNTETCKLARRVDIGVQKYNLTMLQTHAITPTGDIYVGNIMPPFISKLDNDGNEVSRYDLTGIDGMPMTYLSVRFSMDNYIPLVIDSGKIICPLDISQYRSGPDVDANDVPIALIIDTIANTAQRTLLPFPNKPDHVIDCHSRVFDGERYVYSFGALSDLYVSTDFESFTTIKAESDYIGQVKNELFNAGHATENQYVNHFYTRAEYGNIVWDKYNAVFYRFCHAKCKESDKVELRTYNEYYYSKGDFSIQIFNKNLEVIGETYFESGKYAPKIFFLDKDGLWLSENNIERADMTEDILVFRCLELVNNNQEDK